MVRGMGRDDIGRMRWMDSLRGGAVLLIVVFHAALVQGFEGTPAPVYWLADATTPYRVPALMFASGMLLERSLRKQPTEFVTGKVRGLLWPWLVWTAVMAPLIGVPEVFSLAWWLGGTHTWFLTTLFVLYLAGMAARRVPAWVMAIAFFTAFRALDLIPEPGPYLHFLTEAGWFGGYFFAGAALGHWIMRGAPGWMILPTGLVAAAWAVYSVKAGGVGRPLVVAEIASLAGVVSACLVLARVPRIAPLRALQWVGRNSIVVYVVHWPVAVAMAGYDGTGWVGILVRVGVMLAVCLSAIAVRESVPWLYQWPRRTTAEAVVPAGHRSQ